MKDTDLAELIAEKDRFDVWYEDYLSQEGEKQPALEQEPCTEAHRLISKRR